jgi:hypothetical protein
LVEFPNPWLANAFYSRLMSMFPQFFLMENSPQGAAGSGFDAGRFN